MNILAIETSCDETSAAVVKNGREVLSNIVTSQVDIHSEFGGVVPEVAARAHIENIIPVIQKSLAVAGVELGEVDSIAVTKGAGLLPSLLTGVVSAKSLAAALEKPLIPVNHIVGHIYANWIGKSSEEIEFPALALVVSGGHTDFYLMSSHMQFEHLGGTMDDAAGEAFDKVAKLLGLGYPGGPIVSKLAEKGDPAAYNFPRSQIDKENFEFSFSGLKTSVIYKYNDLADSEKKSEKVVQNFCASFQKAVVDVLVAKSLKAAGEYNVKSFLLAGGVSANTMLREELRSGFASKYSQIDFYLPDLAYCLDNAAMIGVAAHYIKKTSSLDFKWSEVEAESSLRIEE